MFFNGHTFIPQIREFGIHRFHQRYVKEEPCTVFTVHSWWSLWMCSTQMWRAHYGTGISVCTGAPCKQSPWKPRHKCIHARAPRWLGHSPSILHLFQVFSNKKWLTRRITKEMTHYLNGFLQNWSFWTATISDSFSGSVNIDQEVDSGGLENL